MSRVAKSDIFQSRSLRDTWLSGISSSCSFLSITTFYPFSLPQYFCVETFSARRNTDILYRRSMDLNFLWSHSLQERKILREVAPCPMRRKRMQRQLKRRMVEGYRQRGREDGWAIEWINQSESASFSRDIAVSWRILLVEGILLRSSGIQPSSVSKGAPRISIYLFQAGGGGSARGFVEDHPSRPLRSGGI